MSYSSIRAGLQHSFERIATFLRPNTAADQFSEDVITQWIAADNEMLRQNQFRWAHDTAHYLVHSMQRTLEARNQAKNRIMTELTETCGLLSNLSTIVLGYIPRTIDELEEIVSQFLNTHLNDIQIYADELCPYKAIVLQQISQYSAHICHLSLNVQYVSCAIRIDSKMRTIGYSRLQTLSMFFPHVTHIKFFHQNETKLPLLINALITSFRKLQFLDVSNGESKIQYTRDQLVEYSENSEAVNPFFV